MMMETKIYDPTDHTAIGRGETMVLLPGLFAGSWIWDKAIPHFLAAGYRVLALQHPLAVFGKALSSMDDLRNFLQRFYAYMEIDRAILVGNSLGGLMAVDFARTFPRRVRRLIASGVPGLGDSGEGFPVGRRIDRETLLTWLPWLLHDPSVLTEREVDLTAEILGRRRYAWNIVRLLQASRGYDVPEALSGLRCPSLLLWGRNDRITPVREWETAVELIPEGRLICVDECGHSPMLEKPEEFSRIALRFLREIENRTRMLVTS